MRVRHRCELGNSGDEAFRAIEERLASASAEELAALDIARDADGGFRLPMRTLPIIGRKPDRSLSTPATIA